MELKSMEALIHARRLARFITDQCAFSLDQQRPRSHGHIGATLADSILQAGLNYRTVVLPRIERIKHLWPSSSVMAGLLKDLARSGANEMLRWNDKEKPRRFEHLVQFINSQDIQTESELRAWISDPKNKLQILDVHGVGPKTADYLERLVGGSAVAVDRHIRRFVGLVCPSCIAYEDVNRIMCFAADLLEVDRGSLDMAVWKFMTDRAAAA